MAGPVEELTKIREALGDLPQRLADVLRRSDSPLGGERGPDGRFLPRGQPDAGRKGGPVDGSDVMRSLRRFASAGAGLPGPVGGALGAVSRGVDLYHRLKEMFEAGRELRDNLHFRNKGATVAPAGAVPPVQRPPGPPDAGPPPQGPTPKAPTSSPQGPTPKAPAPRRGPAPKAPDWGDSAEAGEYRSLQNMLDRGAELDDGLQKRFGWLKGKFNEWAGGGPTPGAGKGGGIGASGPSDEDADDEGAAKELMEAAKALKDAAESMKNTGGGRGKNGGGGGHIDNAAGDEEGGAEGESGAGIGGAMPEGQFGAGAAEAIPIIP